MPFIREEFPDTAYWNPSLITNSDGRGQVTMTLPDSLTTWQVDVRGLTVDTKVGETRTQIVSTKPLLVRPVTPRFLVSGDHVLMAAIVNNNTSDRLTVDVKLQSEGFVLDEPDKATQQVEIPANGRVRVEWWGTAGPAETADLVFSAATTETPSLQDSTRPAWGAAADPALQLSAGIRHRRGPARRGFAAGSHLPAAHVHAKRRRPECGINALAGWQSVICTGEYGSARYHPAPKSMTSYYLPNLEVYQSLNGASLNDPALTDRVASITDSSVHSVLRLQNEDGGWNWWGSTPVGSQTTPSDPVHLGLCNLWLAPRPPGRRQRG